MISEIQFPALALSKEFAYAAKVPFFITTKSVAFKPGLNILFGPNGCGKSTVLRMAALALAAEQGGVSTVTRDWLSKLYDYDGTERLAGITVLHDGQPVMYGNPRNAVGLIGGGAGFDDDFMQAGVASIRSKASTGYTTMQRLGSMIEVSQKDAPFPARIDDRISARGGSHRGLAAALAQLKGTLPPGPKTLIFDEPESGLAIPAQGNLFNLLYAAARENGFQIIVATHSTFSLCLPEANYIEMAPDYLTYSEEAISSVHLRLEMRRVLAEVRQREAGSARQADAGGQQRTNEYSAG
jgi:ABC-type cobalamin/Fe3+-siderophores transport system ATPase subunit